MEKPEAVELEAAQAGKTGSQSHRDASLGTRGCVDRAAAHATMALSVQRIFLLGEDDFRLFGG